MDREKSYIQGVLRRMRSPGRREGTGNCPDERTLTRYLEGLLGEEEALRKMEMHLAECDACLNVVVECHRLQALEEEARDLTVPEQVVHRTLATLEQKLGARDERSRQSIPDEVDPKGSESIFDLVLQIVGHGFRVVRKAADMEWLAPEPMPAALRGLSRQRDEKTGERDSEEGVSFSRKFKGFTLTLHIFRSGSGPDFFDLQAKLSDAGTGASLDGYRVTLQDMEHERESLVTRNGTVLFEGFEAGKYRLDMRERGSARGEQTTLIIGTEGGEP